MAETAAKKKRYNLALPDDLYGQLQELADKKQTTVVALLRQFIKLGLTAVELEDKPDGELIFRQNGKDVTVKLFL
ncbi:MAG: hypothetical protein LCH85_22250 [Chloroflexi bacterium]|nr:hypothetical protein [Chloroflexota bacterium]